MVTVSDLASARPQQWREAADDVLAAAKLCDSLADLARDEMAATLEQCWVGDAGRAARQTFVRHADDYEVASVSLRALARVYDDLAADIADAQRDLNSALDYAGRHGLTVDESGRVAFADPIATTKDSKEYQEVRETREIVMDALAKAGSADTKAARELRAIEGLTTIGDPAMAREALSWNSPLAIALRLSGGLEGVHPVNVPSNVLHAVKLASAETGISQKLLLAILWQEQQWYQNHNPSLRGPLTEFGRFFNWGLLLGPLPDKSLGITHMKPDTARGVAAKYNEEFQLEDGRYLSEVSDAELAAVIEQNPELNIRLSAYHLHDLRENQYGAATDKQLFTLYAADTPDVREKNEQHGDDSDHRGGDIKARGQNWDRIEAHLDDALAWDALSDEERATALRQLESQTPAGHHVSLDPIYTTTPSTGTGRGEPEPGTPSPSPGPAPTPPGTHQNP
jgi:soluble lytic murein transglycosylase-like protein